MANRIVLLTSRLTQHEISLARRERVGLIAYEICEVSAQNLPSDIRTQHVGMEVHHDLFKQWKLRVREDVRLFCEARKMQLDAPLQRVGIDQESAMDFIRQRIARDVQNDYRLVLFGRALFSKDRVLYVFSNPALSGEIGGVKETFQAQHSSRTEDNQSSFRNIFLATPYAILSSAKSWLLGRARQRTHLVFEQMYPMYEANNEFLYFYTWLRSRSWNVLYLVQKRDWELASVLKKHGQSVVANDELMLQPSSILKFSLAWLRLVIWAVRNPLPLSATSSFGQLLFHYVRCSALVATYDFRFYMKMRGDVDLHSAAIRKLLNRHGIRMISYSHATYYDRGPMWSRVHSDYFGYSGRNELETFSGSLMPKDVAYIHAGQLSVENPVDEERIKDVRDAYPGPGIGIYPSTARPYETALSPDNLRDFIDVALRCASRYSRDRVIFKEKDADDSIQSLVRQGEEKYGLRVFSTHHSKPECQKKLTAVETYKLIDFGLVFSVTTCGFELLALEKRVLVYEPLSGTHPFERYSPWLVASTPAMFEDHFEKLSRMSDMQYKNYIRPTIEYCGKKATGKLVESFLQSVPGLDAVLMDLPPVASVHG